MKCRPIIQKMAYVLEVPLLGQSASVGQCIWVEWKSSDRETRLLKQSQFIN